MTREKQLGLRSELGERGQEEQTRQKGSEVEFSSGARQGISSMGRAKCGLKSPGLGTGFVPRE